VLFASVLVTGAVTNASLAGHPSERAAYKKHTSSAIATAHNPPGVAPCREFKPVERLVRPGCATFPITPKRLPSTHVSSASSLSSTSICNASSRAVTLRTTQTSPGSPSSRRAASTSREVAWARRRRSSEELAPHGGLGGRQRGGARTHPLFSRLKPWPWP
jgi:hypothetical protein